jgi:hypothetical protein
MSDIGHNRFMSMGYGGLCAELWPLPVTFGAGNLDDMTLQYLLKEGISFERIKPEVPGRPEQRRRTQDECVA